MILKLTGHKLIMETEIDEDQEYEHLGPLDETAFRKWAYDWNMLLLRQDEDLIVGQPGDYDIWFDILRDTNCPKFDYIIGCIDYHLKYYLLRGFKKEAKSATHEALMHCQNIEHREIRFLEARLKLRLETSEFQGRTSKEQAIKMGRVLLMCKNQVMEEVELINSTLTSWIVGQRNSINRLRINKLTGKFKLQ